MISICILCCVAFGNRVELIVFLFLHMYVDYTQLVWDVARGARMEFPRGEVVLNLTCIPK
jgi:hypothetical protein